MTPPVEPLSPVIVAIMHLGDVVFAASGALVAARHRMDALGIVLIGVITGIGGGTLRDILLGQPVRWVKNRDELILCSVAAFLMYFLQRFTVERQSLIVWADALGLAALAVVGAHVAVMAGSPVVVAAFTAGCSSAPRASLSCWCSAVPDRRPRAPSPGSRECQGMGDRFQ